MSTNKKVIDGAIQLSDFSPSELGAPDSGKLFLYSSGESGSSHLAVQNPSGDTDFIVRSTSSTEVVGPLIPRKGTLDELKDVVLAEGELAIITDRGGASKDGAGLFYEKGNLTVVGAKDANGDLMPVKDLPWNGVDFTQVEDSLVPGQGVEYVRYYSNAPKVLVTLSGIKDTTAHGGDINVFIFQSYSDFSENGAKTTNSLYPGQEVTYNMITAGSEVGGGCYLGDGGFTLYPKERMVTYRGVGYGVVPAEVENIDLS